MKPPPPGGRHLYLAACINGAVLAFVPEPDATALAVTAGAALATLLRLRRGMPGVRL